jgi:hypothetical protein
VLARRFSQVITGYYDGNDPANFQDRDTAERNVPGAIGFV